jgi:hypothetical protein
MPQGLYPGAQVNYDNLMQGVHGPVWSREKSQSADFHTGRLVRIVAPGPYDHRHEHGGG